VAQEYFNEKRSVNLRVFRFVAELDIRLSSPVLGIEPDEPGFLFSNPTLC
jgi:hypothetical protein